MKLSSSFEAKVLLAFFAALAVVGGLVATQWKVASDAREATARVNHTHEVINSLFRARGDTLQIEFSTQSYRITGDPGQLVERNATIAAREQQMERIKALVADNPRQQARWDQLRQVIDERLAISYQVERLRATQGQAAATAYVATAPLRETRQRTYRLLQEMVHEEVQQLDTHTAAQQKTRTLLAGSSVGMAFMLLVLLVSLYLLIIRQLRTAELSQRALVESEENLATTLHSIGDGVLATDTEARVTRMNPVAEVLTGWPLGEARGRPVDEVFTIVHEVTRAPAEMPVHQALATGEVQGLASHTSLVARGGEERPIADSAAPIRDGSGAVIGAVLVFRDVTAERQAQRLIREQNATLEQRVRERTAQLRESQDHLRSVIANVPAMIAHVDAHERYVYVNDQYRERFAPGQHDLAGRSLRDVLGEARYDQEAPRVRGALQGEPQSHDWEPFPTVWQAISYLPRRDADGDVTGCYVLGQDITDRKHHEQQIHALNTELRQRIDELQRVDRALRTLSAGNRAMLRARDEQSLLDSMCQAIADAGGYPIATVWYALDDEARSLRPAAQSGYPPGLAVLQQIKATWADNARGRGAIGTAIRTGEPSVVHNMLVDPDYEPWRAFLMGNASCIACPLKVGGRIIGALSIFAPEPGAFGPNEVPLLCESADDLAFGIATLRARTEQEAVQRAMQRLSHFDPLTALPNETLFTQWLTEAIDAATSQGRPFAALQINIERLSDINDALGFLHGDQLLKEFAARLRAAAPEAAPVARLRGDEFALLLADTDAPSAVAVAQRLEAALAQPFPVADILIEVSANTGIVVFPDHGDTVHDLYRHMDLAESQARRKGSRHAVFDPSRNPDPARSLGLAGELRRAIEGGDLVLHLQPKVDFASGRVTGAEGLVRWQHAYRGLVYPGDFIGLAERTGLIRPLTEWVIQTALRLNAAWRLRGQALPIAVNLSARNLRDEDLLKNIRGWGAGNGLLELEITESTTMEDPEFALRVLHELRQEGIPLYIDDFGTGYSSLSYLQKLPVEFIKIDQSFVRDMSTDRDSALIVRSTIDLAHDLGRKVVAEGIETQADWDHLAQLGCDLAQGYFIARPMPADGFPAWVERFRRPALAPGVA